MVPYIFISVQLTCLQISSDPSFKIREMRNSGEKSRCGWSLAVGRGEVVGASGRPCPQLPLHLLTSTSPAFRVHTGGVCRGDDRSPNLTDPPLHHRLPHGASLPGERTSKAKAGQPGPSAAGQEHRAVPRTSLAGGASGGAGLCGGRTAGNHGLQTWGWDQKVVSLSWYDRTGIRWSFVPDAGWWV